MLETVKDGNRFVVKDDGEAVAEITFVPQGEATLVIDHTYVDPAWRGQKLAEDLVKLVVDHAKESNRKIIPACRYAHSLFRRKKEYQDVWQQG